MDLSVREVARLLDVDEVTVIRWAREGRLTAHRWDEEYRFNRIDLQECASALGRPLPSGLFGEGDGRPLLSASLRLGGVRSLKARSRDEILAAIAALPELPASVDRKLLHQLLAAREALATTAIGRGVAVPHPRDPLVVRVPAPVAALCLLEEPVDFGAPDGQPVHAVFTLLCPTVRAHLQLLAALSAALHDPALAALLRERAGGKAILARVLELEAASEKRR